MNTDPCGSRSASTALSGTRVGKKYRHRRSPAPQHCVQKKNKYLMLNATMCAGCPGVLLGSKQPHHRLRRPGSEEGERGWQRV